MPRKIAGIRSVSGLTAATLTVLGVSLAGCGSSGAASSASSSSASASPAAGGTAAGGTAAGSSPGGALALSHMKVLTKLKSAQLCGVLSAAQAARILHAKTAAPVYASRPGLGITCQWIKRGAGAASADNLYVGISTVISWTGAQALDKKLLRTRVVRIDGHPGLAAGQQARLAWAQVDVALGTAHDPVAEYRAPTLAIALAMAKAATPHILAQG
jgi:hypothetical protein